MVHKSIITIIIILYFLIKLVFSPESAIIMAGEVRGGYKLEIKRRAVAITSNETDLIEIR
jgi:hypothetical protein